MCAKLTIQILTCGFRRFRMMVESGTRSVLLYSCSESLINRQYDTESVLSISEKDGN